MLYQKQKSNPRSPLTVIRNHIKNNLQTSSRSISRSPSYSPVSRNLKCSSKDYSGYLPVRSLSKIENTKPSSDKTTHNELKSKRKTLCNESKKLEERVREIKKKVENEVKSIRSQNRKKIPKSYFSLFYSKLSKVIGVHIKQNLKQAMTCLKIMKNYQPNSKKIADNFFKIHTKLKFFKVFSSYILPLMDKRKTQNEIAQRHYKYQLLLTALGKWEEFVSYKKLNPDEDCSLIDISTLIHSFFIDSQEKSMRQS